MKCPKCRNNVVKLKKPWHCEECETKIEFDKAKKQAPEFNWDDFPSLIVFSIKG